MDSEVITKHKTLEGESNMKHVKLTVEGMSCNHCVVSIEGAVKELGAVGKVDLTNKTVDVTFDDAQVSLDKIKEAIEDQGYDVKE